MKCTAACSGPALLTCLLPASGLSNREGATVLFFPWAKVFMPRGTRGRIARFAKEDVHAPRLLV
jgi:hypothetical protein